MTKALLPVLLTASLLTGCATDPYGRTTAESRAMIGMIGGAAYAGPGHPPDTVKLLALMVRFVVVDVTDPQSAPYEIGLISMLNLRSTPVVPLIQGHQKPFAMLEDVLRQNWRPSILALLHPPRRSEDRSTPI